MATRALTRIQVRGFRSFKDLDLDLSPTRATLLIGPNGAGKSNLLSFLRMVPLVRTGSLQRFVGESGGASALLHYGPKTTREIQFRLEFAQEDWQNAYEARLGLAAGDTLIFLDEQVAARRTGTEEWVLFSLGAGHKESRLEEEASQPTAHAARAVRWWLGRMNFFHFHDTSASSALRANARKEDCHYLRSDGSNLGAYLLALRDAQDEADQAAWRRINLLVRQVAPFVKGLQPTAVNDRSVRLDWIDDRDELFAIHHLSDGTLRAIALLTALSQPARMFPAFASIDEPELGLHPAALGLLAGLVKSASPRCQVLLATQSPALLDHFDAGEVVVTERVLGESRLRRLEPRQLENWLAEYKLSDLFDKNILGGRP